MISVDSLHLSSQTPNHHSTWSGNEADFVILSSVRTKQAGFLKSQPRMNVALTRCRKGMVVVTDKNFLQGVGRSTLLGQLCRTWSRHHDACWIDSRAMLNNSGALPGLPTPAPAPAPARPPNVTHSHNLSWRTTMPPPPRNLPPSQTQTQTQTQTRPRQTHQDQAASASPLAPGRRRAPLLLSPMRMEQHRHITATAQLIVSVSNSIYQHRGGTGNSGGGGWGGGGGGVQSAARPMVVRRDLDDDEFPSLQPLATPLGPTQTQPSSSRQHSWRKGRK